MRAYHIMTPKPITVQSDASITKAADLMLANRISGLPVVDSSGKLVGIVSEGDFLRRGEIGTRRRRSAFLEFFAGTGKLASEFVREEGRSVKDIMTPNPVTISEDTTVEDIVRLIEEKSIKRLPVLHGNTLVGIVTRANLLHAVANLARNAPQPTASDDDLRRQVLQTIEAQPWRPMGLNVLVRDGIVDLNGVITDERQREATIVAARNLSGVKAVHDQLCWVDTTTGVYVGPPT
jgi:CBS-domain-containing membrane protein